MILQLPVQLVTKMVSCFVIISIDFQNQMGALPQVPSTLDNLTYMLFQGVDQGLVIISSVFRQLVDLTKKLSFPFFYAHVSLHELSPDFVIWR